MGLSWKSVDSYSVDDSGYLVGEAFDFVGLVNGSDFSKMSLRVCGEWRLLALLGEAAPVVPSESPFPGSVVCRKISKIILYH